MQLLNLITVVGLALSHVQAAIPAVVDHNDMMIKKVVTLIMDPSQILETIPEFKGLMSEPLARVALSHEQMHQGAREILTSLRDVEDEHWPLIFGSLYGYHHTVDPKRAEIYRDSMYSRMVDLKSAHEAQFQEHIQMTYDTLLLSLKFHLQKLRAVNQGPIGSEEKLKKLEEMVTTLKDKKPEWLTKLHDHVMAELHRIPTSEMEYLKQWEVNDALRATNIKSNDKYDAMLVLPLRDLLNHEHPQSQVPAPQPHHTSPPSAAHAPQPVTVAA